MLEGFDFSTLEYATPIIVIYKSPNDYPEQYAARLWDINVPTDQIIVRNTLQEIREVIAQCAVKMYRFVRDPKDDPTIVEMWI